MKSSLLISSSSTLLSLYRYKFIGQNDNILTGGEKCQLILKRVGTRFEIEKSKREREIPSSCMLK